MGSQSVKAIATPEQRKQFIYYLLKDLDALEQMIKNDVFERNIRRIGAEQELCIVDKFYRPSFNALEILDKINDHHFTTELGLFNLEANLDPIKLKDKCFSELESDLYHLILKAKEAAASIESNKIILTGILPTFKRNDLVFDNMTPYQRYKVLNEVMRKIRGKNFRVQVRGVDELILDHESILFEACNTSFQVHLQVDLDNAVEQYNWSQAIAGPMLSVMTNSPMLLGRELWSETRIALFQQSIDLRNSSHLLREQKPRVSFGTDWVKNSILELYTDDVARYAPLVTDDFEDDSMQQLQKGIMPKLKALNLHNGTLYKWNRLCYGVNENIAHLRIENRYIPAGPSIKDEVANALFWVGVMLGMPDHYKDIHLKMSFKDARGNFIKAARTGMDSYFSWLGKGISARKLIRKEFLPMAYKGLQKYNIDPVDIKYYLNIIEQRLNNNMTGSKWLVQSSRELQKTVSREESNILMTYHLHKNQSEDVPVSQWKLAKPFDKGDAYSQNKVYKIMTTELFIVNEGDSVELIRRIMNWKNIRHLPVVDKDNKIVGVISSTTITREGIDNDAIAKDIMKKSLVTGYPEMKIEEAKDVMLKNKVGCLPILDHEELVGILTTTDFTKLDSYKA